LYKRNKTVQTKLGNMPTSSAHRFLLIDDDPLNNMLCKVLIRQIDRSAIVLAFTNSEEGLSYIEKDYPANGEIRTILLLDLNMPRMTGWEFMEKFVQLPKEIRDHFDTYILSSSVDIRDRHKADANPVIKGYIEKPLRDQFIKELLA